MNLAKLRVISTILGFLAGGSSLFGPTSISWQMALLRLPEEDLESLEISYAVVPSHSFKTGKVVISHIIIVPCP